MAVSVTQTAAPASVSPVADVAVFTGLSIGAAASDRIVCLCYTHESSSGAPTGILAGAAAMTLGPSAVFGSMRAQIWYLAIAAGTTTTFTLTWNTDEAGTTDIYTIAIYSVLGSTGTLSQSGTDTSTDMDSTDPLTTGSITLASGDGFLAVAACATDTVAKTWANATEDIDSDVGSLRQTTATRVTSGTVTITCTGGTNAEDGTLAWVVFAAASAVAYSLTAAVGAFTLSGKAALQKISRLSSLGTYALTGVAALKKITQVASLGTYALTGQDVYQMISRVSSAGAYVLTGIAAILSTTAIQTLVLAAAVGSYVVSGQATTRALTYFTAVGSYLYTGVTADLSKIITLVAVRGTYTYSGMAAALNSVRKIVAVTGSYTLTGWDATLTKLANGSIILVAAAGSYTVTGIHVLLAFYPRIRHVVLRRVTQAKLLSGRVSAAVLTQTRAASAKLKKIRS